MRQKHTASTTPSICICMDTQTVSSPSVEPGICTPRGSRPLPEVADPTSIPVGLQIFHLSRHLLLPKESLVEWNFRLQTRAHQLWKSRTRNLSPPTRPESNDTLSPFLPKLLLWPCDESKQIQVRGHVLHRRCLRLLR